MRVYGPGVVPARDVRRTQLGILPRRRVFPEAVRGHAHGRIVNDF